LNGAAADVAQAMASGNGAPELQDTLQNAGNQLASAAQASQSGDMATAQQQAAAAQNSIAQAQAMLAQAQAGIAPESGQSQQSNSSAQSTGQASSSKDGQALNSSQQGQAKASSSTPQQQHSQEQPKKTGIGGTVSQPVNEHSDQAFQKGARQVANTKGRFIGLPARDRAVIEQSQSEKYPEEYGSMVEQYMQNLSDTKAKKP